MLSTLVFVAAFASAGPPLAPRRDCLPYGPNAVNVTGTLVRLTFYGAPGFGEDPAHDKKERGFYLEVTVPVCTIAGRDDVDRPLENVRRVQLVLDSAGYARLRPFLGKRVTLRGTLFGASTGHHHAPLLLDVFTPVHVVVAAQSRRRVRTTPPGGPGAARSLSLSTQARP